MAVRSGTIPGTVSGSVLSLAQVRPVCHPNQAKNTHMLRKLQNADAANTQQGHPLLCV